MNYLDFVDALTSDDMRSIKFADKSDLHCHALLSTRLENVEQWLGKSITEPPKRMDGIEGMMEYADTFLIPHIRHKEGFEFVVESAINDAIDDGVVRLEMSIDIRVPKFYPDGLKGLSRFLLTLIRKHRLYIDIAPELGIPRTFYNDTKLMNFAHDALERDVFNSIDLYSEQEICPPEVMKLLFQRARNKGMKLKAHVGEFTDAEEIRRTVEVLDLDEVQHGIAAAESVEVMKWLNENQIRLNVCPTSNVMLGSVDNLAEHPIRILYDNGVQVSINTDDLMIFGQSVSDEYRNLYQAGVFTAEELDDIRRSSLKSDPYFEHPINLINKE